MLLACCVSLGATAAAPPAPEAQPPASGAVAPAAASGTPSAAAATAPVAPGPTPPAARNDPPSIKLEGIAGLSGLSGKPGPVGLNDELVVHLAVAPPTQATPELHASRYALFFNGREVKGLPDPVYYPARQSLVFELKRNDTNKDLWSSLLGSPSPFEFTREVTVSLGERSSDSKQATLATIVGVSDGVDKFQLQELPPARFGAAVLLIAGVLWLVFARTGTGTMLRDNLLPQIKPTLQSFSLARCQMAFWFVLILCSFVFLYIITWDYNTISQQALALMGISGATALAAVAVDVAKDSPADAVNRGLRALGLNSYADVLKVQLELSDRLTTLAATQAQLSGLPTPTSKSSPQATERATVSQRVMKLQIEIQDRESVLRTYNDRIRPYLTEGWFRDVTTDLNGAAIHRLQVFCWTAILGAVFVIGVYQNLAMPEFSNTLLALLGISGAGYVGFKYPEKNS